MIRYRLAAIVDYATSLRWAILRRLRTSTRPFFTRTAAIALLLATQALLLAYSSLQHSPTDLEPAFLVSGISNWQRGRFDLYRVNPPLVRMVAALPVVATGCKTDWSAMRERPGSRAEFRVARDFIKANGRDSLRLLLLARIACIPFSLIGAYVACAWASELYGRHAGMLTLVLYVFEPNLLAHGELITPDAACTAFGILSGYSFWRWLKHPTWGRAVLAGISLGVTELTKMSWIILLIVWPLLWIWSIFVNRTAASDKKRPPLRHLVALLVLAIYTINLGYAFDGTGTRLGDFDFVSTILSGEPNPGVPGNRFKDNSLGVLPVPLPKQYVLGLDSQKRDLESFRLKSYLCGEVRLGGWWYYYIYGLLIKVPCGTWGLLMLAILSRFFSRESGGRVIDEAVLLVPAIVLLVVVSSHTEFNIHLRYVFPSLGLALVFVGQAARLLASQWLVAKSALVVFVIYSVGSVCSNYPHQLSYFNDFVGGPRNGYKYLLGSSLDWNQDLLLASRFASRRGYVITEAVGCYSSPEILGLMFPALGCPAVGASHIAIVSPNVLLEKGRAFPSECEIVTPALRLVIESEEPSVR